MTWLSKLIVKSMSDGQHITMMAGDGRNQVLDRWLHYFIKIIKIIYTDTGPKMAAQVPYTSCIRPFSYNVLSNASQCHPPNNLSLKHNVQSNTLDLSIIDTHHCKTQLACASTGYTLNIDAKHYTQPLMQT